MDGWNRKSRKRSKTPKNIWENIRSLMQHGTHSYHFPVLCPYQSSTEIERKVWSRFTASVPQIIFKWEKQFRGQDKQKQRFQIQYQKGLKLLMERRGNRNSRTGDFFFFFPCKNNLWYFQGETALLCIGSASHGENMPSSMMRLLAEMYSIAWFCWKKI